MYWCRPSFAFLVLVLGQGVGEREGGVEGTRAPKREQEVVGKGEQTPPRELRATLRGHQKRNPQPVGVFECAAVHGGELKQKTQE